MKKKQFEAVCRELVRELPGYTFKGWLLYSSIGHLLRGFCCNPSGSDGALFTVQCFVLPLYIPTNHIYYLFGTPIKDDRGCEMWWNINDANLASELLLRIRNQGISILGRFESPKSLIGAAQELPPSQDARKWEVIAYSLAMADEVGEAREALDHLVHLLDLSIPWQAEMGERAKQLERWLNADSQGAKRLFKEWEQATLRNLGL